MQMQFENIFNIDSLEIFFFLYRVSKYCLESLYVPSIRICYKSFIFIVLIAKPYITKANKCCLHLNLIYITLMEILLRPRNTFVSNSSLLEGKSLTLCFQYSAIWLSLRDTLPMLSHESHNHSTYQTFT